MAPERGPKSFRTFEKQVPAFSWPDGSTGGALGRHRGGYGSNPVQARIFQIFLAAAQAALKCDDQIHSLTDFNSSSTYIFKHFKSPILRMVFTLLTSSIDKKVVIIVILPLFFFIT